MMDSGRIDKFSHHEAYTFKRHADIIDGVKYALSNSLRQSVKLSNRSKRMWLI